MSKTSLFLASAAILLILLAGCTTENPPQQVDCPGGGTAPSLEECLASEQSADNIPVPEIPEENSEPSNIPI